MSRPAKRRRPVPGLCLIVSFLLTATVPSAHAAACRPTWVVGWTSAQMPVPPRIPLTVTLAGKTLRQTVRPSLGGYALRLRISNLAGVEPLRLHAVTVGRSLGSSAIDPQAVLAVSFDGRRGVIIPPGADYISDPVQLAFGANEKLAISIRYEGEPSGHTVHLRASTTSYLLDGDQITSADMKGATSFNHGFNLAAVDVETCAPAATIVAFGDSITDGANSTIDGNDRWTDRLAERLQADRRGRRLAIVNQGAAGNRLLDDTFGPGALARLDRDVLSQPGMRYLVLLEGVNDIGALTLKGPVSDAEHMRLVERIIGAYRQIIVRAHTRGIKVIGATILPFGRDTTYRPGPANERDRLAVNRWIREGGVFDAVIDFDAALRDPARPENLAQVFDSGDGIHPSPAGYRAMGDAVPLEIFD